MTNEERYIQRKIKVLQHAEKIGYPAYAGAGFALIAVAGNLLFAEKLGANQWIGIALIFAGILSASRQTV